ncbi:MAG: riboflavin synthase [Chloroflexi bacterium]|nr:riboflavin synthase [Chloroflexota bacterium]MYG91153.1 riboflavin synthase [Chloroflexota bacterium]MYJ91712.1 riboflavin synthase [Chloroflexota bacterium]
MFTGIIEEVGEITEAAEGLLRISAPMILEDAQLGDSIAINGVDLTVTHIESSQFLANLMPETYRRSNLGELQVGDRVNLERSVRPVDRLSGHLVRGVVEGRGSLRDTRPESDAIVVTYDAPADLLQHMIVKGPVCIDGVSLTIIDKDESGFAVSLVQYTQQHTNLLDRRPGDAVNLETDILARYVDELLESRIDQLLDERLAAREISRGGAQ